MDWLMGKRKKTTEELLNKNDEKDKLCLQEKHVTCRLHKKDDLLLYVQLPKGVDINEWLATHTIKFFEHLNMICSCLSDYCTPEGCPHMAGGTNLIFYWVSERNKRTKPPAPQYIDIVMSYIQRHIQDESIFPTKYGHDFPVTFNETVRKMFRFFFHIIAHIYYSHFQEVINCELVGHLNTLFHHFVLFSQHFTLVDSKELAPLEPLINLLMDYQPQ